LLPLIKPTERSPLKVDVTKKQILIIDEHPVFRLGLEKLIIQEMDLTVCGHADSAATALKQMRVLRPDQAIVDISLRGTNGVELTKMMKAEVPHLPIIALSVHDEIL
jgi:DNA-binding NarL/FixJ family response regulator